jgi:hypothetical protein
MGSEKHPAKKSAGQRINGPGGGTRPDREEIWNAAMVLLYWDIGRTNQ